VGGLLGYAGFVLLVPHWARRLDQFLGSVSSANTRCRAGRPAVMATEMVKPWYRFVCTSFIAAQLLWGGFMVYRASEGGLSMPAYTLYFYGGLAFAVAFAVWCVAALTSAVIPGHRPFRALLSPIILGQAFILTAVFCAVSFGTGFYLRLAASKPAFRAEAMRIAAGGSDHVARWVGLFRVREADRAGTAVRFITAECGLDDCGVVYSPSSSPPRVGEDSYSDLGSGWWHWHRSW
jgi:hypothetical protein